jgi:mono/diheme cytochrome c family protein
MKSKFGKEQLAAMEKRKNNSNIRTPDEVNDNLYKDSVMPGSQVYIKYCVSCHQRNGEGDGVRFPPVKNSDWVTGDQTKLVNVVLNGLNEPVKVNGKDFNSIMPAHNFLRDDEIAQVLTYLKQNFNEQKDSVSAAEVRKVREAATSKK